MKPLSLWRYRDAALSLTWLNLRLRYNHTLLGAAWSLVNPLFFMAIFTFVFTHLLPSDIPNYPIFILSALLAWNYFQAALMNMCISITEGRSLITKIAFPRAILPLSALLTELVTFLLALGVFLGILLLLRYDLGTGIFALPLLVMLLSLIAAGMGLILAALNVRLRDTQAFLGVFLFGWFFMTPILYTLDQIPLDRLILGMPARSLIQVINPLSAIISAFRQAIYEARFPDSELLLISALAALIALANGAFAFSRTSRSFAERL
ncbi:MAG: hypothetical protein OHK0023_16990 [Anaerolineae bacterium]